MLLLLKKSLLLISIATLGTILHCLYLLIGELLLLLLLHPFLVFFKENLEVIFFLVGRFIRQKLLKSGALTTEIEIQNLRRSVFALTVLNEETDTDVRARLVKLLLRLLLLLCVLLHLLLLEQLVLRGLLHETT